MIEIAGGILLAVAILATAVIWIPLLAYAAVLAVVVGLVLVVWHYPLMVLFPALAISGLVLATWLLNRLCSVQTGGVDRD